MRLTLCTGMAGLLLLGCGAAPDAAALRGQRLLAQYQCGNCHAIPDVSASRGRIGPPLAKLGQRSYISGEIPMRLDTLARWIEEPAALVPGTQMPDMGASEADARDMAAYLLALK